MWPPAGPGRCRKGSGAGRLRWVLAVGFLGHLIEEGLSTDGLLAVDGHQRFGHGLVRLGRLDDGAVGPDGRSEDQGEREGVAWTSGNLGDALWAVDHDDGVVGALEEAVDADLAHVAAESVDQAGGQVGAKRSDKLGGVAQEA
jgi:hypothetical protein